MGLPSTDGRSRRGCRGSTRTVSAISHRLHLGLPLCRRKTSCTDTGTQKYPTNNYCLGYAISRVSPTAYANSRQPGIRLLACRSRNLACRIRWFPACRGSLQFRITLAACRRFHPARPTAPPTASSCALDAVGYAVNQLFDRPRTPSRESSQSVPDRALSVHSIPLCLFSADQQPSTALPAIPRPSTTPPQTLPRSLIPMPIQASAPAARISILRSQRINSHNHQRRHRQRVEQHAALRLPRHRRRTDPQIKGRSRGGWSGSNHATTISHTVASSPCKPLKNRGIIVSVLYIPYQPIQNP